MDSDPGPNRSRRCGECGDDLPDDWSSGLCASCIFPGGADFWGSPQALNLAFDHTDPDFESRYQFLERDEAGRPTPLKTGGQGAIYRVYDTLLRREIAMKRPGIRPGDDAAGLARFEAEAQIASQLQHPGFLPIYDAGNDPQQRPFFTTQLLSGKTLHSLIKELHSEGPPTTEPLADALRVLIRVCEAVGYAHRQGVYHRDLKPNNVLLGDFGEVFVIDFGAAAVAGGIVRADRAEEISSSPESPLSTRVSGRPGHPLFTPPEMVGCDTETDGRAADIFALGVVLYQICSGRLPYALADGSLPPEQKLLRLIREGSPRPVRGLNRRISRDLEAICAKATSREPGARYRNSLDLASDLDAFLRGHVVTARPAGMAVKLGKWAQRNSRPLAITLGVLFLLTLSAWRIATYRITLGHNLQIAALREAQLAVRQGSWRSVLGHLDEAERAGYTNRIDLALSRIEAWSALSDSRAVRAQLDRLQQIPDLGRERGRVTLRLAEYELFSAATATQGLQHVQDALGAGLGPADERFAKGLLAVTTPEALGLFQEALEFDPFHHGAHRQSVALEFMLGQNDRLKAHFSTMRVLFPDDPTPRFIEACRLALDGDFNQAEQIASRLRELTPPVTWSNFLAGLRMMDQASRMYELDGYLSDTPVASPNNHPLVSDALAYFRNADAPVEGTQGDDLRLPHLPAVKNGIDRGMRALFGVMMSAPGADTTPMTNLAAALEIHPEALLPFVAALLREPKRPEDPDRLRAFLKEQSELYERAISLPTVLPSLRPLCQYMAAISQVELARRVSPPEPQAHDNCVRNLRGLLRLTEGGPARFASCFRFALGLHELGLAREFLDRWIATGGGASETFHARVDLEIASEALPAALRVIDGYLGQRQRDSKVVELAQQLRQRIARISTGTSQPRSPEAPP